MAEVLVQLIPTNYEVEKNAGNPSPPGRALLSVAWSFYPAML